MKQVIISTTLPQHTAPNTNLKQNLRNTTLHSPRPACQKGSMRVHYELHSRRLSLEVHSEFHRPPVEHGFILLVQYIDRVVSLRKGCVHDADGVVGSAGRRHLSQGAVKQIISNRLQHKRLQDIFDQLTSTDIRLTSLIIIYYISNHSPTTKPSKCNPQTSRPSRSSTTPCPSSPSEWAAKACIRCVPRATQPTTRRSRRACTRPSWRSTRTR